MAKGRIRTKWRPALRQVLGLVLGAVALLPLLSVGAMAVLAPRLGSPLALLALAGAALLVALILGVVLRRLVLRPTVELAEHADAARQGRADMERPRRHYGTQETARLGQALIDLGRAMAGREAVLRSYADHATHELKAPLTALRRAADLLDAEEVRPEERRALLARIDEAADRMTALLEAQRALARTPEPASAGRARVGPLVSDLGLDHPGVAIRLGADEILPVGQDALRLILEHLVGNSEAAGAREVRIEATAERLFVADDGPGIPRAERERVFDPFHTTRRAEGASGMGLTIVRRMLEAQGARIRLLDGPGAQVEILF